ncbi:RND efflux system, outer membrane lipoprotein, NodT family [Methylocella silvestris BL2]|uniref:RND efflux system, outer membrane lipoprotein, NodT family n=1 Tax=Methylocella silvestris (strain DSM 15510 / CIP 108128 / LMG 27833 / NCIMB 13906 / BL2) TaxID=395965 RepID=B8EKJ4_METSB|nr:efflux transporter outer membrane subunit [Methylocella silvestris]ACK51364.1 RND efflux system, outer membrane lipoprotein, NodT family [Methylocella silvestris BL2]
MTTRKATGLAAAMLACLTIGGCYSVGPDFTAPDPLLPRTSFLGKPEPRAEPEPPRLSEQGSGADWWRTFHDKTLTSLAERVAGANLDIASATVRLGESRAQRGVVASAAFPSINGQASYQRELYSKNGILSLAGPNINAPPISVWQTGFDASWELDIWGRVRRQVESADASLEASEYQRRDILVSTLAELARDYVTLRGAQAQIAILTENLKSASDILELTRTRTAKGLTSDLDVQNAAALVESIKAQLPALQNDVDVNANAISFILDEQPGSLKGELMQAKSRIPAPPRPPLGVPSELARRRPDIRAAEAQLHATTADIGVAVADFYPSVKLNGNLVLNALDAKNLWKGSSLQYQFGPSVSLPIFEAGRLKSTLDLRSQQQQEAAIAYHKTVLSAWHEIVNALNAYSSEQRRRDSLKAQVDHASQALAISRTRYNNGVADFLTVLDAQRTVLQAMQQQAQSTTNVSISLIQLYKALGGGWQTTFPTEPPPPMEAAFAPL